MTPAIPNRRTANKFRRCLLRKLFVMPGRQIIPTGPSVLSKILTSFGGFRRGEFAMFGATTPIKRSKALALSKEERLVQFETGFKLCCDTWDVDHDASVTLAVYKALQTQPVSPGPEESILLAQKLQLLEIINEDSELLRDVRMMRFMEKVGDLKPLTEECECTTCDK